MIESPLGGILGATTCSVYRLDPTGTVPVEPIPDLVPGVFTPFRVTLDIVDNETFTSDADVTQHPVQDFFSVTSHVQPRLKTLAVTGTLGGSLKSLPFQGPGVPSAGARLDLTRVKNLEALQASRQPLMAVTPRRSLARCFLATIQAQWARLDGEQTTITLLFVEARIVSPIMMDAVAQDFPAQNTGNNSSTGGGQAPTMPAEGVEVAPSPTPGVAPSFFDSGAPAP